MAITFTALKTELTGDPFAIGYAALGGNHIGIAALLNTARTGAAVITLPSVSTDALFACFSAADYAQVKTNLASDREWLDKLLLTANVQIASPTGGAALAKTELGAILTKPNMGACRARVLALVERQPTRAEELGFGIGVVITAADVARAYAP